MVCIFSNRRRSIFDLEVITQPPIHSLQPVDYPSAPFTVSTQSLHYPPSLGPPTHLPSRPSTPAPYRGHPSGPLRPAPQSEGTCARPASFQRRAGGIASVCRTHPTVAQVHHTPPHLPLPQPPTATATPPTGPPLRRRGSPAIATYALAIPSKEIGLAGGQERGTGGSCPRHDIAISRR